MAFTLDSTIADIMARPDAQLIISKHADRPVGPMQLQMVKGMSIQQVAGFLGWSKEKVDALLLDLNEAAM